MEQGLLPGTVSSGTVNVVEAKKLNAGQAGQHVQLNPGSAEG
jgi:hypothetical protein